MGLKIAKVATADIAMHTARLAGVPAAVHTNARRGARCEPSCRTRYGCPGGGSESWKAVTERSGD
jgi:hypothetical protein